MNARKRIHESDEPAAPAGAATGAHAAEPFGPDESIDCARPGSQPVIAGASAEGLQVDLAEYSALRDEILNAWEWQKSLVQSELTALTVAAALVSLFKGSAYVYLFLSFLLNSAGLMFVEQSLRMTKIGRYMRSALIPRIQARVALSESLPELPSTGALGWEAYFRNGDRNIWQMGVTAVLGKYLFAILPGLLAACLYIANAKTNVVSGSWESVLLLVAVLMSFLPIFIGLLGVRFSATGKV